MQPGRHAAAPPVEMRPMPPDPCDTPAWQGSLVIGDDWAVWRGAVGDGSTHRHFAAQAVLGGGLQVVVEQPGDVLRSGRALFVEPLQVHRLGPSADCTLVFIEPRACPAASLPADVAQALRRAAAAVDASALGAFWTAWLARPGQAAPDSWEATAREAIDTLLPAGAIGVAALAARMHLSAERLRHVFPQRVGMGFRRFVLWRRLWRASQCLNEGETATAAAHAAGFADAAHFARTLRATFGVTASQLRPRG